MPRPSIDIDQYRNEIINWACVNITHEEIAKKLQNKYVIPICKRTVTRRLQQWDIQTRTITKDTPFLRAQIAILYRMNCTDEEMLEDLEDMGYQVLIWAVTRVRKQMGLVRRISVFNRQALDSQLFEILRREL